MNVTHVLSLSAIGGVQKSFLPYFNFALKESEFNHEICLTRSLGEDFSGALSGNYYSLRTIKGFFRLLIQLNSKNHIVHFYNSLGSRQIYFLLKFAFSSKIIFHERGSVWNSNSSNRKYFLKNIKKANKIVCNSKATKEFLLQKFNANPNKLFVIHNGISYRTKSNKKTKRFSNKTSIGFIGRYETQKGIPSLIEAAKYLKDFNFYFAGYGPWENYIDENVRSQKNIFNIGKLNDPFDFLKKVDIVVIPSIREPFGNVIVEAGISKKAVIASMVDGIPEIINSEDVGLLVKPTDEINYSSRPESSLEFPSKIYDPQTNSFTRPLQINPKILAEKISLLVNDHDLRQKLGDNLFDRVQNNFNLKIYHDKIENLYLSFN